MTLPTVEIISFDSSKQYQDDPAKTFGDLVELLKTAKGLISTYHAPQVEDNGKGYLVIQWKSYEDHKVIMDSPTYDVDVIAKLLPVLASVSPPSLKMVHVEFDKDPTKAFESPVTEFVVVTMKPECKDKTGELKDLLTSFIKDLDTKIALAAAWGQAREDEDLFVAILGWESVEAHMAVRNSSTEETRKVTESIRELATYTVNHTKLAKYI